MQIVDSLLGLRAQIRTWRAQQMSIAFVPTMGNLHQGHLSLVQRAQTIADKVVVSIFVNPLQFDDKADLQAYPRTLQQDIQQLSETDCDLLFTPPAELIYPKGMAAQTKVVVPGVDDKLCGKMRPGHFDGVATVVTKLFNLVQADMALFGEKDYQQLLLIRQLVEDLNVPIDIVAVPTCREQDGLAMSSRNHYLTEAEREIAPQLYQSLLNVAEQLRSGNTDWPAVQSAAVQQLASRGFKPEYLEICRAADLETAHPGTDTALRILLAARLGKARLIDNIACDLA
ncbi:MAG: pantoate--beta-alanine ligase [Methylophaga sp.]|nr:pantoate--beta-alanine ligase [Methylophaga sp.]